jgi:hypothetical protein
MKSEDPETDSGHCVRHFQCVAKGFRTSSALMPNEYPLPDDLQNLIDKRGGRDRRKKTPGRDSDEDDRVVDGVRRPSQRDRRQQKNFRDLLNQDDDD